MGADSAIKRFEIGEASLVLHTDAFSLRLTKPADRVWRLQSAPSGANSFDDMGAAQILARDLGEPVPNNRLPFLTKEQKGDLVIETPTEQLTVNRSSFSLAVEKPGGGQILCLSELRREGAGIAVYGPLHRGEALFGGGQRFNRVNQRGKRVDVMAIDQWCWTEGNSYVPVPFILSSRRYGLFLNRYEYSIMDLGKENENVWSFLLPAAPLDLYLFADPNPANILNSYADLTGHAPLPAPWLFGIQVCRHSHLKEFASSEGIEAMIQKMAENDFPWDAVITEGWGTFYPDTYEDLRKITNRVHSLGKKILLYEACGRVKSVGRGAGQEATEKILQAKDEYFIREPDGNIRLPENWTKSYNPIDNPNPARSLFIDITNPAVMDWWYDFVWGPLVKDIGVDGAKVDFCEEVPDHIPLVFHDGRNSAGAHHWYPTLYNTLMYRYYQKHRPEGGMCFSRGGGIGAQRYPFLWTGDKRREFAFLQIVLTGILSSGLSGIPFMSHDMAGYMPAMNGDPEEDVFIRGTEMGCFSSNMQTHGMVTRPYGFPTPIKDIYRVYSKLHQALRPYLVEQAQTSCRTGMPLMRHLFLYDPEDLNTPEIEDEYMLGSALLAAPVFSMAKSRDIYLPRGNWRNILNGKTYTGGQTLKAFPVPFHQIPVFLLEGNDSKTIDAVLHDAGGLLDTVRRGSAG